MRRRWAGAHQGEKGKKRRKDALSGVFAFIKRWFRFRNDTEQTYRLLGYTTPTHLCGELRTDAPLAVKYHIASENERFVRENGVVYRCSEVHRSMVDKTTGNVLSRELLRRNHARVLYDTAGPEILDR